METLLYDCRLVLGWHKTIANKMHWDGIYCSLDLWGRKIPGWFIKSILIVLDNSGHHRILKRHLYPIHPEVFSTDWGYVRTPGAWICAHHRERETHRATEKCTVDLTDLHLNLVTVRRTNGRLPRRRIHAKPNSQSNTTTSHIPPQSPPITPQP